MEGLTFAPSWTAIGWTYATLVAVFLCTVMAVNRSLRGLP